LEKDMPNVIILYR